MRKINAVVKEWVVPLLLVLALSGFALYVGHEIGYDRGGNAATIAIGEEVERANEEVRNVEELLEEAAEAVWKYREIRLIVEE